MNETAVKLNWWERVLQRPWWMLFWGVLALVSVIVLILGVRCYRFSQLIDEIRDQGGVVVVYHGNHDGELFSMWHVAPIYTFLECFLGGEAIIEFSGSRFGGKEFQDLVVPFDHYVPVTILEVSAGTMSPESFKSISELSQLKSLTVSGKDFGDESLVHLRELNNLEDLSLDGTSVSSEGLKHLHQLKKLSYLSTANTNVTEQGLEELQKHLPALEVSDD